MKQCGFRKKISTTCVVNRNIEKAIDNKQFVFGVFTD